VGAIADVRAHPGSRRMPRFNRDALARELDGEGVVYRHIPELGGRRRPIPDGPNQGWRVESFRGYADHMASAEFQAGVDHLQEMARRWPTTIMCAEGVWWRCHRRLVADALVVRGWEVVHISPDGGLTTHELTSFAVPHGPRITYPPAQASLPSG
jgi:uncharacterized protein (DUF488 family)